MGNDSDSRLSYRKWFRFYSRKMILILGTLILGTCPGELIPILLHENDSDSGKMILGLEKMIPDILSSVSFTFRYISNKRPPLDHGK